MNIYVAALVIFLTALAVFWLSWLLNRGNAELDRITLLARVEEGIGRVELPRAGLLPLDPPEILCAYGNCLLDPDRCFRPPCPRLARAGRYGPFPVDTGPLLILSEQAAANVALEREIRQRCDEAEAKIPPRWR